MTKTSIIVESQLLGTAGMMAGTMTATGIAPTIVLRRIEANRPIEANPRIEANPHIEANRPIGEANRLIQLLATAKRLLPVRVLFPMESVVMLTEALPRSVDMTMPLTAGILPAPIPGLRSPLGTLERMSGLDKMAKAIAKLQGARQMSTVQRIAITIARFNAHLGIPIEIARLNARPSVHQQIPIKIALLVTPKIVKIGAMKMRIGCRISF